MSDQDDDEDTEDISSLDQTATENDPQQDAGANTEDNTTINTNHNNAAEDKTRKKRLSARLSQQEIEEMMAHASMGNGPEAEVMNLHREKELLLDAYAKIDVENNSDIELEEFQHGMKTMGVELNDEAIEKVFLLMDSDESGYIDKNEFVLFLTQKFGAQTLVQLQQAVLSRIEGIGDNMQNEAEEMRALLMGMVEEEVQVQDKEEILQNELKAQEEQNPDFAKDERCQEWTIFEVGKWLENIGLEQYSQVFMQTSVDGKGLLYDLDENTLTYEMGVKRVHIAKLMRAIASLKQYIVQQWQESDLFEHSYQPYHRAVDQIAELKKALQGRNDEVVELKKEYEGRIKHLMDVIEQGKAMIQNAQQQGFILGDHNEDTDGSIASVEDFEMVESAAAPDLFGIGQQTVQIHGVDQRTTEREEKGDDPDGDAELTGTRQERSLTAVVNELDDEEHSRSGSMLFMGMMPPNDLESQPSNTSNRSDHQKTPSSTSISLRTVGLDPHQKLKGRHHRKKSSKAFWSGKKRPPTGTKAYWLFLEAKKANNPSFGAPTRVLHWHHHEIAFWLRSVKCDKYVQQFVNERVSGETLVKDMTSEVLNTDLGVKMLHCGKMMREIRALRIAAKLQYDIEDCAGISITPSREESAALKIERLSAELSEKAGEIEEDQKQHEEVVQNMNEEQEKLKTEIEELEKQVVELEARPVQVTVKKEPEPEQLGLDIIDDQKIDDSEADEEEFHEIEVETEEEVEVEEEVEYEEEVKVEVPLGPGDEPDHPDATTKFVVGKVKKKRTETLTKTLKKIVKKLVPKPKKPKPKRPTLEPFDQTRYPKQVCRVMEIIRRRSTYDPEFGKPRNAMKWLLPEVLLWLDLIGFPSYIPSFLKNQIDGEILVYDMNDTILHEDLGVKRFHTGKMSREIRRLKNMTSEGLQVAESENFAYTPSFSAVTEIERLNLENQEGKESLNELEAKMQELIDRPQIEDSQMIIEKEEYEATIAEKDRLAQQVDTLEDDVRVAREAAVPEQEKKEATEAQTRLIDELKQRKEDDDEFAVELQARSWTVQEVMYFMISIGQEEYIKGIQDNNIIGEILIEDVSADLLSRDIGVKRTHIKQILRQIEDLKHRAFGYEVSDNLCEYNYEPEDGQSAVERFANYEASIAQLNDESTAQTNTIQALREETEELTQGNTDLNTEKEKHKQEIRELHLKCEDLKQQQLDELDDNAKQKVQSLEEQISSLNETITTNNSEYEAASQEMTKKYEVEIDEKQQEIETLNTDLTEVREELTQAQQSIAGYEHDEKQRQQDEEAKDNSFEAQLKRRAESDPTFAVPKRAHKWNIEEVCHWLFSIGISDYVGSFREELIDGSILLADLSAEQLKTELGIKPYHIGKITREINKLKELAAPPLTEADTCEFGYQPEEPAVERIAELEKALQEQSDINGALVGEAEIWRSQAESLQAAAMVHEATQGGEAKDDEVAVKPGEPVDAANDQEKEEQQKILNKQQETNEQQSKEIEQLRERLDTLELAKMTLVQNTASEMQRLRNMVKLANKAYSKLTGTPLGQVAEWPSTHQFFRTLGLTTQKKRQQNLQRYRERDPF